MGYGNEEDTIVTKFIADDGVDVVINLDKLGLKKIVVQAKRYDKNNLVSIPTIKEFGGTMLGTPGVKEGIFITTSSFTAPALAATIAATLGNYNKSRIHMLSIFLYIKAYDLTVIKSWTRLQAAPIVAGELLSDA